MDDPFDGWSFPEPAEVTTGDPTLDGFLQVSAQNDNDDLERLLANNNDEVEIEENDEVENEDDEENNEDEDDGEISDRVDDDDEQNNGKGLVGKQLFASSSARNEEQTEEKKNQPRTARTEHLQANNSVIDNEEQTEEKKNQPRTARTEHLQANNSVIDIETSSSGSSEHTEEVYNEFKNKNTDRSSHDPQFRLALLGNRDEVECANRKKCTVNKILKPYTTFHKCKCCKEFMCSSLCSFSDVEGEFLCYHCSTLNAQTELISFDPTASEKCIQCKEKSGWFLFSNEIVPSPFCICLPCLKDNKHYPGLVWKKIYSAATEYTKLSIKRFRSDWMARQQQKQEQEQRQQQEQEQKQRQQQQVQQQQQQQQQKLPSRMTGRRAFLVEQRQEKRQQQQVQQQQQEEEQKMPSRLTGQRALLVDYCPDRWTYCQVTGCHSNCGFYKVQNTVTNQIFNLCPKHVREKMGEKWMKDQTGNNPRIAEKIARARKESLIVHPPSPPKKELKTSLKPKKKPSTQTPATDDKPKLKISIKKQQNLPTQNKRTTNPLTLTPVATPFEKENESSKEKKPRNATKAKDLTEDEKTLLKQNSFKPTHVKKKEYYSLISYCVFPGVEQKASNADYIHCELCDGIFDFNNYTNSKVVGKHYEKCISDFEKKKAANNSPPRFGDRFLMLLEDQKELKQIKKQMKEKQDPNEDAKLLKLLKDQSEELKRIKEMADQQAKEMQILRENREREAKEIEELKKAGENATMPTNPTNFGVLYGQQQVPNPQFGQMGQQSILQPNLHPHFGQMGQQQSNLHPQFGQIGPTEQQSIQNVLHRPQPQQDLYAIFQQQQQQQQQQSSQDLFSFLQQRPQQQQPSPQDLYAFWQFYQSTKK